MKFPTTASCFQNKRQLFIHIHIPKTAGSTFGKILKNNFGRAAASDNAIINYQHSSTQIEQMIKSYPMVKSFSSHRLSLDLPFHLDSVWIQIITHIRNPVDRFISHYFYHRNNQEINTVPAAKTLNFRDYIQYALIEGHQAGYINGQTRYLSGSPDKLGLHKIKKLLDDGHLLLFPVDRFDESCIVLERSYPNYFNNCAYVRVNISRKDQVVTEEDKNIIRQFIDYDSELLQMTHVFLDSLIKNYFAEEDDLKKALAEFRGRCKKLERKGQLISFLRPVHRSLRKIFGN